jgi:NAD(P)-dependent dehydrogenase (short-subunit alcohol dehydrogenase family)
VSGGVAGWSAADIPDQSGRAAVVTGANSGIGLVAARELARAGAKVILACRDVGRGEAALADVQGSAGGAAPELGQLDLADLRSVREFSELVAEENDGIDLLINNAGVMAPPRRLTADGFELQFGTNHLGHFALTGLLLKRLLSRPEPRVVTVSSPAHRIGRIRFDDLNWERRYERWQAYGQSKLANLLFAFELQRRAEAAGTRLRSFGAHPGYAATNLQPAGPGMGGGIMARLNTTMMAIGNRLLAQSQEMGSLPTLFAATAPELPGGSFAGPTGLAGQRGYPGLVGSSGASKDREAARRLWEASEELTGVSYRFA